MYFSIKVFIFARTPHGMKKCILMTVYLQHNCWYFLQQPRRSTVLRFYIGVIFDIKLEVSRNGIKTSLKVDKSISGHRSILILLKNVKKQSYYNVFRGPSLKTLENLWFPDFFRRYKNWKLAQNELQNYPRLPGTLWEQGLSQEFFSAEQKNALKEQSIVKKPIGNNNNLLNHFVVNM